MPDPDQPPKPDGRRGRKNPPQALRDMRWVWENDLPDGARDETVARRRFREMLAADPKGYSDRLAKFEAAFKAGKAGAAAKKEHAALRAENERLRAEVADLGKRGPAGVEDDPGTECSQELIEKLMVDAGNGVGPDGKCLTCGQSWPAGKPTGAG